MANLSRTQQQQSDSISIASSDANKLQQQQQQQQKERKKAVRFATSQSVHWVPNVKDYSESELKSLWWTTAESDSFRVGAKFLAGDIQLYDRTIIDNVAEAYREARNIADSIEDQIIGDNDDEQNLLESTLQAHLAGLLSSNGDDNDSSNKNNNNDKSNHDNNCKNQLYQWSTNAGTFPRRGLERWACRDIINKKRSSSSKSSSVFSSTSNNNNCQQDYSTPRMAQKCVFEVQQQSRSKLPLPKEHNKKNSRKEEEMIFRRYQTISRPSRILARMMGEADAYAVRQDCEIDGIDYHYFAKPVARDSLTKHRNNNNKEKKQAQQVSKNTSDEKASSTTTAATTSTTAIANCNNKVRNFRCNSILIQSNPLPINRYFE